MASMARMLLIASSPPVSGARALDDVEHVAQLVVEVVSPPETICGSEAFDLDRQGGAGVRETGLSSSSRPLSPWTRRRRNKHAVLGLHGAFQVAVGRW
jgi:hypothetical protein